MVEGAVVRFHPQLRACVREWKSESGWVSRMRSAVFSGPVSSRVVSRSVGEIIRSKMREVEHGRVRTFASS